MIRNAWGTLLILGLLACGSSANDAASGGSSADGGGGSGEGASGGAGGGGLNLGGSGGSDLGPGGGGSCNSSAAASFDGVDGTSALLEDFQIAPSSHVSLCWFVPGDKLSCSHHLWMQYEELTFGEPVAVLAATLDTGDGTMLTGEPGFTITFEDTPDKSVPGSFSGTVTDGSASYPVSGTFEGCPYATE